MCACVCVCVWVWVGVDHRVRKGLGPAGSPRQIIPSQNREGPRRGPWGEGWLPPSLSSPQRRVSDNGLCRRGCLCTVRAPSLLGNGTGGGGLLDTHVEMCVCRARIGIALLRTQYPEGERTGTEGQQHNPPLFAAPQWSAGLGHLHTPTTFLQHSRQLLPVATHHHDRKCSSYFATAAALHQLMDGYRDRAASID